MDLHLAFLERRRLPLECYLNGDPAPAFELVAKHVEAVRAFVAEIRQSYATQEILRGAPRLTADDVARAENELAEVEHELAVLQWRQRFGQTAREVEGNVPLARPSDAHLEALRHKPTEPQLRPTSSTLPIPAITYAHGSAVLEFLGAAEERSFARA